MFDLKADPSLPHHYIIGVAMHSMKSGPDLRGKMFLKYGSVYFNHKDIDNVRNAAMMSVDKVFKTTSKEATEMFECQELSSAITGLKIAAYANQATLHHFSSEFEFDNPDEVFESFVKSANISESTRRQLDEARIGGY
ncbi:MAG: hypothetical protein K9L62_10740 [Vallitaleaceae bacterium]|nr:hypothetical protein [Vallitaleaceae bacterium]